MLKIGKYDQRIAIQRVVTEDDGSGGTWGVWQTMRETWAEVTPVNGTRQLIASEQVLEDGLIVRIRRNEEHSLAKDYAIVWRGERYQIQSIIEINAEHWVWEMIVKKTGDGFVSVLGTNNEDQVIITNEGSGIQIN